MIRTPNLWAPFGAFFSPTCQKPRVSAQTTRTVQVTPFCYVLRALFYSPGQPFSFLLRTLSRFLYHFSHFLVFSTNPKPLQFSSSLQKRYELWALFISLFRSLRTLFFFFFGVFVCKGRLVILCMCKSIQVYWNVIAWWNFLMEKEVCLGVFVFVFAYSCVNMCIYSLQRDVHVRVCMSRFCKVCELVVLEYVLGLFFEL